MKVKCVKCGHEWEVIDYNAKKIRKAVEVNGDGPYCGLCLHLEMASRHAELRGLTLKVILIQNDKKRS